MHITQNGQLGLASHRNLAKKGTQKGAEDLPSSKWLGWQSLLLECNVNMSMVQKSI